LIRACRCLVLVAAQFPFLLNSPPFRVAVAPCAPRPVGV
jgi:hypothetical protein